MGASHCWMLLIGLQVQNYAKENDVEVLAFYEAQPTVGGASSVSPLAQRVGERLCQAASSSRPVLAV
jgi:hypothetical protein